MITDETPGDPLRHFRLSEAAREGDFDRWLASVCPTCSGDATSPLRVAGWRSRRFCRRLNARPGGS